jgi:hypothetical protein
MSLNPLSDFFKRFQHLTIPDETIRKTIVGLIKEQIGATIVLEQVSVKNNSILIKTSPAIKSGIFLRKQELLRELKERTGKDLSDIR